MSEQAKRRHARLNQFEATIAAKDRRIAELEARQITDEDAQALRTDLMGRVLKLTRQLAAKDHRIAELEHITAHDLVAKNQRIADLEARDADITMDNHLMTVRLENMAALIEEQKAEIQRLKNP